MTKKTKEPGIIERAEANISSFAGGAREELGELIGNEEMRAYGAKQKMDADMKLKHMKMGGGEPGNYESAYGEDRSSDSGSGRDDEKGSQMETGYNNGFDHVNTGYAQSNYTNANDYEHDTTQPRYEGNVGSYGSQNQYQYGSGGGYGQDHQTSNINPERFVGRQSYGQSQFDGSYDHGYGQDQSFHPSGPTRFEEERFDCGSYERPQQYEGHQYNRDNNGYYGQGQPYDGRNDDGAYGQYNNNGYRDTGLDA